MSPVMISIVFFVAGLAGAACKAFFSNDQATWSRKSVGDVVLGGLTGILFPLVSPMPLPTDANILQQAAIVAAAAYMGSDVIQNVLQKFGKSLPGVPSAPPSKSK